MILSATVILNDPAVDGYQGWIWILTHSKLIMVEFSLKSLIKTGNWTYYYIVTYSTVLKGLKLWFDIAFDFKWKPIWAELGPKQMD